MSKQAKIVQRLLLVLRQRLQEIDAWQVPRPEAAAFTSSLPFCVDTMSLEQWLRYVFMARMQALLDAQVALPVSCALTEQVEMQMQHKNKARVMEVTQALDAFLTANTVPAARLLKEQAN